ncbi:META domain-containing protein [Brachyspira hampsonii]|uniref:Heat shock protein n=1 Tax=Brachyspira hampsonii 30446 TaxID=1289135 RepID=A0A2U4ETR0_9SPIR|nr:META domain-containing protein [Brachyspira hampsonii]EKV55845.1 Heat shock protein [Brachyspira hampsonii 30446]MBW5390990.1 META domain-containing protein [Brachyspira hampsonii]MBW5395573.1 META domain-containing protein [Brachyspira hampsonii]OEJ13369.1 heat-shock protein [Brachyspira hampsonii]
MKYIVHILAAVLFIFSCSTAKVTHIEEPKNDSLFGRKFKLVSIYPDMDITIEFTQDTIHGFSAVNNYSSSYTLDGDIFNILSISMTKKSGTRDRIAAEIEYLNMLQNATSYKINGRQLIIYTLLSSDNLVFEEF